jgi:hypothetical protein
VTSFVGDPPLLPPSIELLTVAWLAPFLAPVPVSTRMPKPGALQDTVTGLLRVEAGGGHQANKTQFNVTAHLSAYHPDEDQADLLARQACDLMRIARGQTINGYYVVTVEDVDMPYRQTDPDVILPRYFATATWRVTGVPWTP